MFCRFCGQKINEGSKFCPNCGEKLEDVVVNEVPVEVIVDTNKSNTNEVVKERGPWKVFAIVGYVLGIVSICGCFIPGFGSYGLCGIIFSILGKKSLSAKDKAKKGLILSIISSAIGIIIPLLILLLALLISLISFLFINVFPNI